MVQDLSPPQGFQTGSGVKTPPIQWVMWNFLPELEVHQPLQSSAKVKNEWSYTPTALLARTVTSLPLCP